MVTRYEEDLKKSIVEMVKAGRRSDELSKEYGPSADSIRNFKGAKSVELEDGTEVTSKEFKQLQRARSAINAI